MTTTLTVSEVAHIAVLANIPVSHDEEKALAEGFNTVIKVLDKLKSIDVTNVEPTNQVTGLENIMREDVIDEARMFTQDEALANAPRKHNGYFLVDQVIDQLE